MTYKNYKITANIPEWNQFTVDENGKIGECYGSGGVDFHAAEFDIYTINEEGDDDEMINGGYNTLEDAKRAVDNLISEVQNGFSSETILRINDKCGVFKDLLKADVVKCKIDRDGMYVIDITNPQISSTARQNGGKGWNHLEFHTTEEVEEYLDDKIKLFGGRELSLT